MRLVAWNANCALRTSRTFCEVLDFVEPLHPDVVVVSEGPADCRAAAWAWDDVAAARLAVWTRPGYSIDSVSSESSIPQSARLGIRGRVEFNLIAIWPVKQERLTYAGILRRAVDTYLPRDARTRTIVAGDLNSNTRVVAQQSSHPQLIASLSARGLTSVYHHQESVAHGAERAGTYRTGNREFCLDYAFVSTDLLDAASLDILSGPPWTRVSDHLPLILDIPEAAFHRVNSRDDG